MAAEFHSQTRGLLCEILRFTEVVGFLLPSYDEPNQLMERVSIEVKYLHSLTIEFDAYNSRQINELLYHLT